MNDEVKEEYQSDLLTLRLSTAEKIAAIRYAHALQVPVSAIVRTLLAEAINSGRSSGSFAAGTVPQGPKTPKNSRRGPPRG